MKFTSICVEYWTLQIKVFKKKNHHFEGPYIPKKIFPAINEIHKNLKHIYSKTILVIFFISWPLISSKQTREQDLKHQIDQFNSGKFKQALDMTCHNFPTYTSTLVYIYSSYDFSWYTYLYFYRNIIPKKFPKNCMYL